MTCGSRRKRLGQTLVEFTFVGIPIIFVLISVFEMSRGMWMYHTLAYSVKQGVRFAIVHGASTSDPMSGDASSTPWPACTTPATGSLLSTVQTYAAASLHSTSSMNIYACYPDGSNKPGSAVQVSVNYPYQPLFGLGWPKVNVSANSAGRIMF